MDSPWPSDDKREPISRPASGIDGKRAREVSAYITEILLEMRRLSEGAGLKHLKYLLELAIHEAFELANGRPPTPDDMGSPPRRAGERPRRQP
jgi:hypothetical protein